MEKREESGDSIVRVSIDGPDAWPLKFHECPMVKLNDVDQSFVVLADDIEGYLIRIKLDGLGKPAVEGDEFVTERLTGRVEIVGRTRSRDRVAELNGEMRAQPVQFSC
jgi:hypothetical protein